MRPFNTKDWTIFLLLILGAISGYSYGYGSVIGQVVVAVVVMGGLDAIITFWRTKKWTLPESGILSGMILGMIAAPASSLPTIALLSVIGILSKYILRWNKRTIFNPAALSLLIGTFFFNIIMGWWADHYQFLTIITGSILLYKYSGHWKLIFAFLITFTVLLAGKSLIMHQSLIDELYLNIGTSFFFMFFMLTDPKTMPMMPKDYPIYGVVAAIGTLLSILFAPKTIFLGGLLLANVVAAFINAHTMAKLRAPKPPQPPVVQS